MQTAGTTMLVDAYVLVGRWCWPRVGKGEMGVL